MKIVAFLIKEGYVLGLGLASVIVGDNVWEVMGLIMPTVILVEFREAVFASLRSKK